VTKLQRRIRKWRRRGWPVCGDARRRGYGLRSVDGCEQLPGASREVVFGDSHIGAESVPLYLVPFTAKLGMHRTGENTWVSDDPLPGIGQYTAHIDVDAGEVWLDWSYGGK
jgi:hypothetical protein